MFNETEFKSALACRESGAETCEFCENKKRCDELLDVNGFQAKKYVSDITKVAYNSIKKGSYILSGSFNNDNF